MGPIGPMGPQGPQGATGPQGPQGPAGLTSGAHVNTGMPTNGVGFGLGFLAPTGNVTITAGQSIFVTSQRAFGTNGNAASGLALAICYSTGGGAPVQSGVGVLGLRLPANTRVNYPMTAILSGLPAGTYAVGLCGYSLGEPAFWNSNESGSTTAVVF